MGCPLVGKPLKIDISRLKETHGHLAEGNIDPPFHWVCLVL